MYVAIFIGKKLRRIQLRESERANTTVLYIQCNSIRQNIIILLISVWMRWLLPHNFIFVAAVTHTKYIQTTIFTCFNLNQTILSISLFVLDINNISNFGFKFFFSYFEIYLYIFKYREKRIIIIFSALLL